VVAMSKLKKWYVIGKKEFPTPCFYGEDYLLHDVDTVHWQPSKSNFGSFNGNYTAFPELVDAEHAINALGKHGIPSFNTRNQAKFWATKLSHSTWKYLKIES